MRYSVKSLALGGATYLTGLGAFYIYTIHGAKARSGDEDSDLVNQTGRPTTKERLAVFNRGAPKYDTETGTDEVVMGLNLMRRYLLSKAKGEVLEVAGGTGRNLDYFPKETHLTVIDAAEGMVQQTERKLRWKRKADVTFGVMNAESMTFPDNAFDTVVDTFGICSFEDPVKALKEMQRVCKPNGRLLLLEHGRAHYDWLNDILDKNCDKHARRWGCIWNRDVDQIVEEAGLEVVLRSRWHFGTTYMIEARPRQEQAAKQGPVPLALMSHPTVMVISAAGPLRCGCHR